MKMAWRPAVLAAGFAGLGAEAEAQGAAGWALRFYGNGTGDIDRVKISIDAPPRPADVGTGDFTVEVWMRALLSENVYGPGDWGDWGISLYGGASRTGWRATPSATRSAAPRFTVE